MEGEEEAEEAAGVVRKRRRVGEEAEEGGGAEDGAAYEKADLLVLGDDGPYEGIAEEAVAEVMRWLEAEIAPPAPPAPADAFVTINESCGPSFSAAASTVMATVDTRAGAPPVPWPWPEPQPVPAPAPALPAPPGADADADMDGADEEWLARLLTCGALLKGVL